MNASIHVVLHSQTAFFTFCVSVGEKYCFSPTHTPKVKSGLATQDYHPTTTTLAQFRHFYLGHSIQTLVSGYFLANKSVWAGR